MPASISEKVVPLYGVKTLSCMVFNDRARRYLQLPLRQWGASNVYQLVLPSWKVHIVENPIAVMESNFQLHANFLVP